MNAALMSSCSDMSTSDLTGSANPENHTTVHQYELSYDLLGAKP